MTSGTRHFILVHGAWHNGTAFHGLRTVLEGRGHRVTTPTLKGHQPNDPLRMTVTLDDYVDGIARAVEQTVAAGEQAVLVAHSSAGFLVQMAAPKVAHKLEQLVFINAWCLQQNQSQGDLIKAADPAAWQGLLGAAEAAGDKCIPVIESFVRNSLMGGDDPNQQTALLKTLVPQPLALMTTPVDVVAFANLKLPKSLIHCEDDVSLPPGTYLGMAQNLGSHVVHPVAGGHEAFFTDPTGVANALEKVVTMQSTPVLAQHS